MPYNVHTAAAQIILCPATGTRRGGGGVARWNENDDVIMAILDTNLPFCRAFTMLNVNATLENWVKQGKSTQCAVVDD